MQIETRVETRDILADKLAIKIKLRQTEMLNIGGAELQSLTVRIVEALHERDWERVKTLNEEFEVWISNNARSTTNLVNVAQMLRIIVVADIFDEEETDDKVQKERNDNYDDLREL